MASLEIKFYFTKTKTLRDESFFPIITCRPRLFSVNIFSVNIQSWYTIEIIVPQKKG